MQGKRGNLSYRPFSKGNASQAIFRYGIPRITLPHEDVVDIFLQEKRVNKIGLSMSNLSHTIG